MDSPVQISLAITEVPTTYIGLSEARIQPDSPVKVSKGTVEISLETPDDGSIVISSMRLRVKLKSEIIIGNRPVPLPFVGPAVTPVNVRGCRGYRRARELWACATAVAGMNPQINKRPIVELTE